jgi:hypothetical protein
VRYLVLSWDDKPIADAAWKDAIQGADRQAALNWGINRATPLAGGAMAAKLRCETPGAELRAWTRPQSILLRVGNPTGKETVAALALDLAGLGIKAERLWRDFTSIVALDGKPAQNVEADIRPDDYRLAQSGAVFNGHTDRVWIRLKPGESRIVCIDRY